MNPEMEPFEQRLRRQPVKPVPAAWRAEILAAARAAQPFCDIRNDGADMLFQGAFDEMRRAATLDADLNHAAVLARGSQRVCPFLRTSGT